MKNNLQRMYFLVRDEAKCNEIEASLIELGVEGNRIFLYDDLAENLVALPDKRIWAREKRVPITVWGILFGGLAGLLSSYIPLASKDQISQNLIILVALVGALLGGIMFRFAAGDPHDKRLNQFLDTVHQRGWLLVTDVPRKSYRQIHQQIVARHPAKYLGSIDHEKL